MAMRWRVLMDRIVILKVKVGIAASTKVDERNAQFIFRSCAK
jgi:hypothetical protein